MPKKAVSTKNAPSAIGPYSQAIVAGDTVYVSGQIPIDPAVGEIVCGDIAGQTRQCFKNIGAILAEAGMTLDNVVKVTVFMTDLSEFGAMNEAYGEFFSEPYPARAAVQVAALPKNPHVEIECIAVK